MTTIEDLSDNKEEVEGDKVTKLVTTTVEAEPITKMATKSFEPPSFVSKTKSYAAYKADLKRWSRITAIDKKLQAEVVVYSLDGDPSGIKDKIEVGIGTKLEDNENGIADLITFLDSVFQQDEMSEAWIKYKTFQRLSRKSNQDILSFISDFEKEYNLAKSAGCEYSDTILAFRLLEASNLSENDEKFILTAVDFEEGKKNKDLEKQMKSSLKKFQGRSVLSNNESKEVLKVDSALINQVKDVLIAQGWEKPERQRRRSNSNPEGLKKNSSNYKGRKNPLGEDGKPIRCFKCQSELHLAPKCDQKKADKSGADDKPTALIAAISKAIKNEIKSGREVSMLTTSVGINGSKQELGADSQVELVMVTEREDQLCLLVEDAKDRGVLDSACSRTVAGAAWVQSYLRKLKDYDEESIPREEGDTQFQFGGGEMRKSLMRIGLPCMVGDIKITLFTEVVDAEIPLLIGTNSLEKAKAKLDFGLHRATIFETEVEMFRVGSGHFCIQLFSENLSSYIADEDARAGAVEQVLIADEAELDYKQLQKLHHVFGHTKIDKLITLIKRAGKDSEVVQKNLEKIKSTCESCIKNSKSKPRPKVALPRASKFGDVVTVDLKEYDRNDPQRRHICYLIDMFSRLTVAKFLPSKEPKWIVETIMEKWIGVGYGAIKMLHSDIGGENCNAEIEDVAANMDIKLTTTASYSPHQNGLNERNHCTVDQMMKKMMESDSRMSPENALFWSLNAKNSLENCYGFSPYQLVFSTSPELPVVSKVGPPGFENVTKSEVFANNINAMNLARQEFIRAESSTTLKKALKTRIHARGEDIQERDWIYYQKPISRGGEKLWRGPAQVVAVNGKKLFIDQGARLGTVNRDCSVKKGEEFWRMEDLDNEEANADDNQDRGGDQHEVSNQNESQNIEVDIEADEEIVEENLDTQAADNQGCGDEGQNMEEGHLSNAQDDILDDGANEVEIGGAIGNGECRGENSIREDFNFKNIKVGQVLQFKDPMNGEVVRNVVMSRAGKATGNNKHWWNMENKETGEPACFDSAVLDEMKKVSETNDIGGTCVEQAFLTVLPRWQHKEPRCLVAKEKELKCWDDFDTYEEVPDEGQETLGLVWVMVEKMIDGKPGVKARLAVRGDQENTDDLRTDSPTISKVNIKLFFLIAVSKQWAVNTCDVRSAFLQGSPLERDVYVRPPKERKIQGILWKMKKRAYGFCDASRGFYLELSKTLVELGCRQCTLDPSLYFWKDEKGDLGGAALTHVDDVLHGTGTEEFNEKVMKPLKRKFVFGSEESDEFRYVGLHVKQNKGAIVVNQNHYLETIEIPEVDKSRDLKEILNEKNQEVFRGLVGKIGWLGGISRPDVAFDNVALSSKLGKANQEDLEYAVKVIKRLKVEDTKMSFPDLGEVKDWVIEAYGDAGHKSMPDKLASCGGRAIVVKSMRTQRASLVSWRSKRLKRIVTSSTAAEALAINDTVGEAVYIQAVLGEVLGPTEQKVPIKVFTDSKNLCKAASTSAMVEDSKLRLDLAILKESLETREIEELNFVKSGKMLANSLTKKGASSKSLMAVLRNGEMRDFI